MNARILLVCKAWMFLASPMLMLAAEPDARPTTGNLARISLDASQSVYVGKSRGWTTHGANRLRSWQRGLLTRELCRQALLLAAREEAGAITRDAWLDEPAPAQGSLALDLAGSGGVASLVELLEGIEPVQSLVWSYDLQTDGQPLDYLKLVQEMEALSRGKFAELLKPRQSRGSKPAAAPTKSTDATLTPAIEKLLSEMSVISQFQAVRTLHATIRKQGESPVLLGGLVRGYANLGLLTEQYWHPMHQVFKARALLYAQRMVARDPASKDALWHRAYALALVGLHGLALDDRKVAAKDTDVQPAWADVIMAFCRYNTVALGAIQPGQAEYELAHVLRVVCAEQSHLHSRTVRVAAEEFEKLPHCTRITGGLQNIRNTMATNIPLQPLGTIGKSVYAQLAATADLPQRVTTLLPAKRSGDPSARTTEEYALRAKVIAALRNPFTPAAASSGKSEAAEELSWCVLGRMILEESFLEFLPGNENSEHDNIQSQGRRQDVETLLADHPYRPFTVGFAWGSVHDQASLAQLHKAIEIDAVELKELSMLRGLGDYNMATYDLGRVAAADHEDMVVADIVRSSDWWPKATKVPRGRELLGISLYSPFGRANAIELDWTNAKSVAEPWEQAATEHPSVLLALGKQFLNDKQYDKAERCLKPVYELDPSLKSQAVLAEVYKRQGNIERWIATLAESAMRGDAGADPGEISVLIADYFASTRQWEKARPYAEAAGQSGSIKGLMVASSVFEALQDWEQSERWIKAASNADETRPFEWYFWCKRTGQGNMVEALQLAGRYMNQREELKITRAEPALFQSSIPGTFFLLKNDIDAARRHFEEGYLRTPNPYTGLHAMLVAQAQNDTARRDLLLKEIETKTKATDRRDRAALMTLAQLFAKDLAVGGHAAFDWDAIEKLAATTSVAEQANFYYFLGVYLDQKEKPEKAIECWKRCMGSLPTNMSSRTLAGSALWERAVQPFEYKSALQPPEADEAQK